MLYDTMSGVLKQFKQEGSAWLIFDIDDISVSSSLDGSSSSSCSESYLQDGLMQLTQTRRNPDRNCLAKPLKPTKVRTLDLHPRKLYMGKGKATRESTGSLSRWDDNLDNSNYSLSNAQWSLDAPLASSNQDQFKKRASQSRSLYSSKAGSRSNPNMLKEKVSSERNLCHGSYGSDPNVLSSPRKLRDESNQTDPVPGFQDQFKKRASRSRSLYLGKARSRSNPNMLKEKSSSERNLSRWSYRSDPDMLKETSASPRKLGDESNQSNPIPGFVWNISSSGPLKKQETPPPAGNPMDGSDFSPVSPTRDSEPSPYVLKKKSSSAPKLCNESNGSDRIRGFSRRCNASLSNLRQRRKSSSAPKLTNESNGSDRIRGFVRRCNASSTNLQRRPRRRRTQKGATLDSWLSSKSTSMNDVKFSTPPIPDLTSPVKKKRPSRVRNLNEEPTTEQTILKPVPLVRRSTFSGGLSPKGLKCSSSSLHRLRRSGEIERKHSSNGVGLDEATKSRLLSASLTMIVDSNNVAWPAPARTRRLRRGTDPAITNSAPRRSGKLDAPPLRIERRSSVAKQDPASKEEMMKATTENTKASNLFSNFTQETLLLLLQSDTPSVTTPVA